MGDGAPAHTAIDAALAEGVPRMLLTAAGWFVIAVAGDVAIERADARSGSRPVARQSRGSARREDPFIEGVRRTYTSPRRAAIASLHETRPALSRFLATRKPTHWRSDDAKQTPRPTRSGDRGRLECNRRRRMRERQVKQADDHRRQRPARVVGAVRNERIVGNGRSGQGQFGTHSDRLPGPDPVPVAKRTPAPRARAPVR